MLYNVMLKGHSHLCDHADLDTSFVSLKSVYLNRLRRLKLQEKSIKNIGEQITMIYMYIWKIAFSQPDDRFVRRESS